MILIEENKRKEVLTQFGFTDSFLNAIDNIKSIDHQLSYLIGYPEGAYYYLPSIKNYSIYKGFHVVPICDAGQGDSFYTLLFNDSEKKIIYNEIEQDEIHANFGHSPRVLIVAILIEYYELMDDADTEDREAVIEKLSGLGFKFGIEREAVSRIISRIFDAEDNEEDRFTNGRNWFDENIRSLLK